MNDTGMTTTVRIEIQDTIRFLKRHWKQLLVFAVLGAVVLGGLQVGKRIVSGEKPVLSGTELAELEAELTGNETTIANNTAAAEIQQENLSEYKKEKKRYEEVYEKAMEVEEVDAALIIQVVDLGNSIASTEKKIAEAEEKIKTYELDIEALTKTNKQLERRMDVTEPAVKTVSILINTILGGIFGLVLVIAFYYIRWCLNETLLSGKMLESRFGIPVIETVENGQTEKARKQKNISEPAKDGFLSQERQMLLAAKIRGLLRSAGIRLSLPGMRRRRHSAWWMLLHAGSWSPEAWRSIPLRILWRMRKPS